MPGLHRWYLRCVGLPTPSLERLVWIFLVNVAGDFNWGNPPRATLPDLTHLGLLASSHLLELLVSDYWWGGDPCACSCAWQAWAPHLLCRDRDRVAAVCPDPAHCWRSRRLQSAQPGTYRDLRERWTGLIPASPFAGFTLLPPDWEVKRLVGVQLS